MDKDGKRNGKGTYTWKDGKKYVGEWKDDLPNGQGTLTAEIIFENKASFRMKNTVL